MRTTTMTDVEGNYEYFKGLVENNEYVQFAQGDLGTYPAALEFVQHDTHLVYTGDVMDSAGKDNIYGDEKVIDTLLDFKRRYGHRVSLVLGNRDMNLLRLKHELTAVWVDAKTAFVAKDFVHNLNSPSQSIETIIGQSWWIDEEAEKAYRGILKIEGNENHTSPVRHLKGMLLHSMGRKHTFEHARRRLLKTYAGLREGEELDALTYISIWAQVQSQPCRIKLGDREIRFKNTFHQYLSEAVVAEIVDEAAFVHGAISQVPESKESLRECINTLNYEFGQYLEFGIGHGKFVAMALNPEARGSKKNKFPGPSFVTSNINKIGNRVPDDLAKWIQDSGVYLVVSGHKPFGNLPHVIRSGPKFDVTMASLDTSYSNIKKGEDSEVYSGRSRDTHEWMFVSIEGKHLHIKGYNNTEGLYSTCSCSDVPAGSLSEDGFTKSLTKRDGGECVYAKSEGWGVAFARKGP